MAKKDIILTGCDGYQLSCRVFESSKATAVIQIIHGMEEHKARYDAFAEFLSKKGFTVITSDLRGHGENSPILSHISNKKGDVLIIDDQKVIRKYINEKYPELPVYLFGHSMGTIISRVLMQTEGDKYQKVALSGYVNPNPVAGIGCVLTKIISCFKGPKADSKLLDAMTTGSFNKDIENPRTSLDWLSYNKTNVDNYIADPLCGVPFSVGSYYTLMKLLSRMGKAKAYKKSKEEQPIFLISGKDDPCTGFDKGREASKELFEKAGYKNINVVTLDHMRHEILNEKDNQKVYDEIANFFLA